MNGFTLAPITRLDAPALAGRADWLAAMAPWSRLGYGAAALQRLLGSRQPDREVWLIDQAGEDAGVLVLRCPWWRGVYIELIAVWPHWQRRGVGAAAIDLLEARCAATPGWDNLWLLVSGFNAPARTFYRRQGFEEVGVLAALLSAGEDEVLLRKRLSRQGGTRDDPGCPAAGG